jgi:molybdopterin synthase catalytic subunit
MSKARPSLEAWLDEIKRDSGNRGIGIFFIHTGVVRDTTRDGSAVSGLEVSCDRERLGEVIAQVEAMPGVAGARAWINEGTLAVGEDFICALVAGDVRKNVSGLGRLWYGSYGRTSPSGAMSCRSGAA